MRGRPFLRKTCLLQHVFWERSSTSIQSVHAIQSVLFFFDIKHYLKNNEHEQKEGNVLQCIQEKLNELNE